MTPEKVGVRQLYRYIRDAFPTFTRRSIGSWPMATG